MSKYSMKSFSAFKHLVLSDSFRGLLMHAPSKICFSIGQAAALGCSERPKARSQDSLGRQPQESELRRR